MSTEHKHSCCCCFSLRTGVWLIGGLQIASAIGNLYSAFRSGDWAGYAIQLAVQIVFSGVFTLHMSHEDRQHSFYRSALFWIYFIFITVVGAVIGFLKTFGYWGDLPNDICADPDILENMTQSECTNFMMKTLIGFVTVNLLFNSYCTYKLKKWHTVKVQHEKEVSEAAYGKLAGER